MSTTRFTLNSVPGADGLYKATDTETGLVLTFRECEYHSALKIQKSSVNVTSAEELAKLKDSLGAIEQWLLMAHPELITTSTQAIRERIGAAIKTARKNKSYTLKQLAALSCVDASNISRIENGTTAVTIDTLAKLSAPLGLTLELR